MAYPLRAINNPQTAATILAAVKQVIVGSPTPNTALAASSSDLTGLSQVFITDEFSAYNAAIYPLVLLSSGSQVYGRQSQAAYQTQLPVTLTYLDEWTQQTSSIDAIWAEQQVDVQRMMSNLQENPTLTIGTGGWQALNILKYRLSGYEQKEKIIPQSTTPLVQSVLTFAVEILVYDA